METIDDGQDKQIEQRIGQSKDIDQDEDKIDKKSKKTVGFAETEEKQNKEGSSQSISSEEDDGEEVEQDQRLVVDQGQNNSNLPELPVKPKVSIQEEISNVVKQIDKKNSVKRPSAFFHSKFTEKQPSQDDQDQDHSNNEDQTQKLKDEQTNQEQIMQEQTRLPERPRFGVQEEIQSVVRGIDKKRSIKRQSTFSQVARQEQTEHKQDSDEEQQSGLNKEEMNQGQRDQDFETANIDKTKEKQDDEQLPERPKVSVQEEIINVVRSIEKKRSVKRQSTFSLAAKSGNDDLNGNSGLAEVAESSEEMDQNSVREQQQLPERPQFGVQEEIKSVVRDIEKKRSVKRQSTFSIAKYEKQEDEEEQLNNNNNGQEPLVNTVLAKVVEIPEEDNQHHELPNTEVRDSLKNNSHAGQHESENGKADQHLESGETSSQNCLPSRPQFGVQDEIKNVVRDIEKKRSIKRQSTFSVIAKKIEQTDDEEDKSLDVIAEDEAKKTQENEEISDTVNDAQKLDSIGPKKPNALQEVIELTGRIEQKKETRRKSNFALLSQPHFEDESENQHSEAQQHDKLSKEQIVDGANHLGKQKNDLAIETVLEGNQEEHYQHLSEEAILQRQKKKKNIMDYKEEVQIDNNAQKKKEHQHHIHQERKMVFFKDSTAKHNKKVIHPTTKSQSETDLNTNSLKNGKKSTPTAIQNSSPEKDAPDILEDHSREDEQTETIPKKQDNNGHRDKLTLQRKLENLTAKQVKSEVILKRDGVSYNKLVEAKLAKEIKAKEANKKKRELEAMLVKLNEEIEFVKSADPDLESLRLLKQEQQRLRDETKAGYMSSIMKSSRHSSSSSFDGLKNPSQVATPDLKGKLINNSILPQLKISYPFKEITTKLFEKNNTGKHYEQASSFIQQIRRNKESKRTKRIDDSMNSLVSQEDHIQNEIVFRRVQNEHLHDKWTHEKQQQMLQKKLKYESTQYFEHGKSMVVSKNQGNRLLGTGSPLKTSINSLGQQQQNGEQHNLLSPSYLTPELEAHKQGLKELRKLNKGEFYTGSAYILKNSSGTKDNSNLKKLLEENQINRDRELQLMQNRNDFYLRNSKLKGSKSVISQQQMAHQHQSQQKQQETQKLEISQSLLFQSSEEYQFKAHSTKSNQPLEAHKQSTTHKDTPIQEEKQQIEQEQQSQAEQNDTANNQTSQNGQTSQGEDMKGLQNSKMWAIKHKHS